MEGLRQISQAAFDGGQKFIEAGHSQRFETFVVSPSKNRSSNAKHRYLVESELPGWIVATDASCEASLRIFSLTAKSRTSLNISKDIFSRIMGNIRVDPSVLYLVCHAKDGFYSFPGSPKSDVLGSYLPTWFIGTSRYAILWTFDSKKSVTMATVIEQNSSTFRALTEMLEKFVDCICAPQAMCMAASVYQMHFYDIRIEGALNDMRDIEKSIGLGPRTDQNYWQAVKHNQPRGERGTKMFAIDEIMALSQKIHEVAGTIKNSDCLRRASARMLEDILYASHAAAAEIGRPGSLHDGYKAALQKLGEAVPVVQRQMDANADYLVYMQYRAENLTQVITALLTHEDVAASIDLASASKKATSSMKIVAIMTMLYLSASFLIACWSSPLLF